MYSLSSRISYRSKLILNHLNDYWDGYVSLKSSRRKAEEIRKKIISKNGRVVVDQKIKKQIQDYCRDAFGSTSYWPWLAVYTELRGKFKQGWIPDDYYRFTLLRKMNPEKFREFSKAKTINHKLFNDWVLEPLFSRSNGLYCGNDGTVLNKSEIKEKLHKLNEEVIIKPDTGHSGKQIMFKHSRELCLDELPSNMDLLFQTVVHQHYELDRLHPRSVNTFRVLTYIDQEGVVNTKFVIIRFGRAGSRIDNVSSGGGWLLVGLDGEMKSNANNLYGFDIGTRHPDTGFKYADLKLPYLPKVINLCKDAHRSFPFTRIIGWDVFINEKEEPKLIEWNAEYPAFWPIEAKYGPFFGDVVFK